MRIGRLMWLLACVCALSSAARAQFRFDVRAEPDVIPANGVSTSSILVQVRDDRGTGISAAPVVRFVTSAGTIDGQATLVGGVARALLRSSTTPGTAVVTAIIGNAREEVSVEFSDGTTDPARYLQITGPYVAYGTENNVITGSGKCALSWGDLRIESSVRMDVDLRAERVWAQGGAGDVRIRMGRGARAKELRGDRLFYDLSRRRGVIRRATTQFGPVRQEFAGTDFGLPDGAEIANPDLRIFPSADATSDATTISSGVDPVSEGPDAPPAPTTNAVPDATSPTTPAEGATNDDARSEATDKAAPESQPSALIEPSSAPETSAPNDTLSNDAETSATDDKSALQPTSATNESSTLRLTGESSQTDVSRDGLRLALVEGRGEAEGAASAPLPNSPLPDAPPTDKSDPPAPVPSYEPVAPIAPDKVRIVEPAPPDVDPTRGYWVTSRVVRIFPRDKAQFERAKIFFNGGKAFSLPLYVLPLDGTVDPANDMLAFNTSGGVTLNFPIPFYAKPSGTGIFYLQNAPGGGFAAERAGLQGALDQQYFLSTRSQGRLTLDGIGRGGPNLFWTHRLQLDNRTSANFFLNMPRARSPFLRASVTRDLQTLQIGLEAFYSRPGRGAPNDALGQFFARTRPRSLGRSGWSYSFAGNLSAQRRFTRAVRVGADEEIDEVDDGGLGLPGGGGIGSLNDIGDVDSGGIGLPGDGPGGSSRLRFVTKPRLAQTLNVSLQSPSYKPWRGGTVSATLLGIAFNGSEGRRGLAPGALLSYQQNLGRRAALQLNYTYDRSQSSLYGADFTHFLSGSAYYSPVPRLSLDAYFSRSLRDNSLYATSSLDYALGRKWRLGGFLDYSEFSGLGVQTYGLTLGHTVANREVTLNWDSARGKFYFEFGGLRAPF